MRITMEDFLRLAASPRVHRVVTKKGDHLLPEHLARRLMNRIAIRDTGCWEWQGAQTGDGYGCITISQATRLAHIVVYTLAHGEPPPAGMYVMHRCDNPPCINPDHLLCGTPTDNVRDCVAKGRARNYRGGVRGERNGLARLTWDAVREIRRRALGSETHCAIAAAYGVSASNVDRIVAGQTWIETVGLPLAPGTEQIGGKP